MERLLSAFPKLFYFMPTLPPQRIDIDGEPILIAEPLDAVLWLLETQQASTHQDYCLQGDLEQLVAWWYPPKPGDRKSPYKLSKPITRLTRKGFIVQERHGSDLRHNRLRLTLKGKSLLDALRAKRRAVIDMFLRDISAAELLILIPLLEKVADITWHKMHELARSQALELRKRTLPH